MVGIKFSEESCHKKGPLSAILKSSANTGLRLDVVAAQTMVANGASPDVAIDFLHECGPLTERREDAMRACLATIAIGECPSFPIIKK